MASVDRDGLEQGLDALVERGVLTGWTRRPLGLYWLHKIIGERLDLDTKKAAIWFEGAAYCGAVVQAQQMLREALNEDEERELVYMLESFVAYELFLDGFEDHDEQITLRINETYGEEPKEVTLPRRDALLYLRGVSRAILG